MVSAVNGEDSVWFLTSMGCASIVRLLTGVHVFFLFFFFGKWSKIPNKYTGVAFFVRLLPVALKGC